MTQTRSRTQITEVRTVAVHVSDQDRAVAFYVQTLGFEKRLEAEFGPGLRWIEVAPPGAGTTIALLKAAEGQPVGVDTGIRLQTRDAAADHASLKALGVDVDAEIIPYPIAMFTFRDPDANRLYVVETPRG
jgi:predicted enzyme related to lactoylglutathione lyase